MKCPHCKSIKIVKNGFTKLKKQRYYCKKCSKSFLETSYRQYPPTSYPFELIAYFLYHNDSLKPKSLTRLVNNYLRILDLNLNNIPRQTVHSWNKNYSPIYKEIISFNTARRFFADYIDRTKFRTPFDGMQKIKTTEIEKLYGTYEDFDIERKRIIAYALGRPPKHIELLKLLKEELGKDLATYLARIFSNEELHEIYIKLKWPFTNK